MKKIFILLTLIAAIFAACNSNEPEKKFVGTWDPVGSDCDVFVITSDSIKAIQNETGLEHYQAHYKMLRDSVAELERCWLGENHSGLDFHPEDYFVAEVKMYIDKDGYLIIQPFDTGSPLSQQYPNYAWLKLKKHN